MVDLVVFIVGLYLAMCLGLAVCGLLVWGSQVLLAAVLDRIYGHDEG